MIVTSFVTSFVTSPTRYHTKTAAGLGSFVTLRGCPFRGTPRRRHKPRPRHFDRTNRAPAMRGRISKNRENWGERTTVERQTLERETWR